MTGQDWRASLRALDIPRRQPPSERASRPDRGHVEQPGEQAPPTPLRRVVISKAELDRAELEAIAEMVAEPLTPPAPAPPAAAPSPPSGVVEMAKKKKKLNPPGAHADIPKADQIQHIERVLASRARGERGENAKVARELGVSDATVSWWIKQYENKRARATPDTDETLASTPAPSGVRKGRSPLEELPPVPNVSLVGLERYVRALVAREVSAQLRLRLKGI